MHFILAEPLMAKIPPEQLDDILVCQEALFLLDFLVRPKRREKANINSAKHVILIHSAQPLPQPLYLPSAAQQKTDRPTVKTGANKSARLLTSAEDPEPLRVHQPGQCSEQRATPLRSPFQSTKLKVHTCV